jgi:hypothetical protein
MDEKDREIQDRISRRRMIKRLGAATAVAWTAPVLSTLGSSAYAQTAEYNDPRCPDCVALGGTGADHCAGQPDCGAEPSGNPCSCLRTPGSQADPDGSCQCHSCVFCDNPAVISCTGQAGCPAGWVCSISCCSDPAATNDFVCVPRCGAGTNPDPCVGLTGAARGNRRTSMG